MFICTLKVIFQNMHSLQPQTTLLSKVLGSWESDLQIWKRWTPRGVLHARTGERWNPPPSPFWLLTFTTLLLVILKLLSCPPLREVGSEQG